MKKQNKTNKQRKTKKKKTNKTNKQQQKTETNPQNSEAKRLGVWFTTELAEDLVNWQLFNVSFCSVEQNKYLFMENCFSFQTVNYIS